MIKHSADNLMSPIVRDSLRDVIANDRYAGTFQSTDKYRSALLQHLDNLDAAQLVAANIHQVNRADAEWSAAVTTAQMVYSDVPDALQAIDYLVALRAFAKDSGKPIPAPPGPSTATAVGSVDLKGGAA
ncbi:hypothetical protein HHL21_14400 [Massilia sp. RP-1-19]|uniref:Uncharacterized protein n=1 Tax=Massilia polaris TaxID=2728846 RepID=A0A848HLZ7_9BURK|nr:hypothetical protein [Massilia polaris]NML62244.1 hypothetical protein [Massilia polaris]